MKFNAVFRSLVVVSMAAAFVGCASFPDKELPKVDKLPDKSAFRNKPSVYVDVKFFTDMSGEARNKPVENAMVIGHYKPVVDKVTKESKLFSRYSLEPMNARDMDYVVKLEMTNWGSPGKAMAAGLVTGLSLFVIPTAATDNYSLVAKVQDKSGRELRRYEVNTSVTTWIGIWLLPMAGNSPGSVVPEVWAQMLKNVYQKMATDGTLQYSSVEPQWLQVAANDAFDLALPVAQ